MAPTASWPKDPTQDSAMGIDSDQPQEEDVQKSPPNQDVSQPHAPADERITEQRFMKGDGSMTKDLDYADTEHPALYNLPVRPKLKDATTGSAKPFFRAFGVVGPSYKIAAQHDTGMRDTNSSSCETDSSLNSASVAVSSGNANLMPTPYRDINTLGSLNINEPGEPGRSLALPDRSVRRPKLSIDRKQIIETNSKDVRGVADAKQEGYNTYGDGMDVDSSANTTSQEHISNSQCSGTLFDLPDHTVAASTSTGKRKRSAVSAVEDENEEPSAGEDEDEGDSDDEEPEAKKIQAERLGERLARGVTSGYDMLPDSLKDSGLGRKLSTLEETNKEEEERLIAEQAKLFLEARRRLQGMIE